MPPRPRRRITSAKREEIEKEQRKLSSTIVRPFDILSGLPVSFSAPPNGHYDDVLKNPLTVKDTGVFYRSLMKSRYNYVHLCPMFCLYWVKQSSYAKKLAEENKPVPKSQREESLGDRVPVLGLDVSARDVMVKLCDAGLSLGPHQFEIRLFILKDGRPEKLSKKEMKELEERKRQEELEARRSEIENGRPDGNNVVNEPSNGDSVNEPVKSTEINEPVSVVDKTTEDPTDEAVKNDKPEQIGNSIQSEGIKNSEANKEADKEEDKDEKHEKDEKDEKHEKDEKDEESESEEEDVTNTSILEDKDGTKEINIEEKPDSDDMELDTEEQNKPTLNSSLESKSETTVQKDVSPAVSLSADAPSPVESSSAAPAPPSTTVASSSSSSSASVPTTAGAPTATARPPPPRSDPNNMQSIENTIMISNLNTIARTDESLNGLMKIVASGNASPQQIVTFQGYIKRAREMGPQPHHAYLFQPGAYSPYPNIKPKKIMKPPKEKKLPKEKKFPKEKKEKKPKLPKDQKLTAFQERYLENATLLFEFVENTNVRFQLPKNAIIEVLPPSTMTNADGDDNSDNKDLLFSYIWIHNQDEISDYEKKLEEYYRKVKERDEAEKKKIEDEKKRVEEEEAKAKAEAKAKEEEGEEEAQPKDDTEDNGEVNKAVEHNLRKRPARKAASVSAATPPTPAPKGKQKKGKAKKKEVIVKLEKPEEPEIRFTTVSFIVHGIPLRFVPILINSVNPLKEVQEHMEHILKVGTRMTNFYLWYQVDGKLDEALAEEVRNQLNQEEKKMPGITAASPSEKAVTKETTGPKKRKLKEKNLDTQKKLKSTIEIKKEDIGETNSDKIESVEPMQIDSQSQKTEIEQNKEQEQEETKHSSPDPEPVAVSTEISAQ